MKTAVYVNIGLRPKKRAGLFSAVTVLGLLAMPLRAQQPTILVAPTDLTAPATFTATFGVFVTGPAGYSIGYQWYFDNQLITGATNHTLNIIDAQATNMGFYVVVASNAFGPSSSLPVTLTVTNTSYQAPSLQWSTLASFNEYVNGAFPQAGVIQAGDGYLYGTTLGGGATTNSNNGTVFKMSTNGAFLWSFAFNNANGLAPAGALVQAGDGNLYGATSLGGLDGFGTVFRMTPAGVLSSLYSFLGLATDGGFPQATLCVGRDGFLYGTTSTNGTGVSGGTVFKMSTNGGAPLWSYPLTANTGDVPLAGLVQGLDGSLYGAASQGGASNAGTIFQINTNGTALTNLYAFTGGADGGSPKGGMVQGPDGQLYGTTSIGGNSNVNLALGYGAIFKITTNGAFTLLAAFDGTNGGSPEASLMVAGDGNLYGTANAGGAGYPFSFNTLFGPIYGTVFQLTTNGTLTSMFSFDGNFDGDAPHATLWQGRDGGLYGTTSQGGTNDLSLSGLSFGDGTVFRLGLAPPIIQSAAVNANVISFTWNAMPEVPYQAQYTDNLNQGRLVSRICGRIH